MDMFAIVLFRVMDLEHILFSIPYCHQSWSWPPQHGEERKNNNQRQSGVPTQSPPVQSPTNEMCVPFCHQPYRMRCVHMFLFHLCHCLFSNNGLNRNERCVSFCCSRQYLNTFSGALQIILH